jgi:hypothetical protein
MLIEIASIVSSLEEDETVGGGGGGVVEFCELLVEFCELLVEFCAVELGVFDVEGALATTSENLVPLQFSLCCLIQLSLVLGHGARELHEHLPDIPASLNRMGHVAMGGNSTSKLQVQPCSS